MKLYSKIAQHLHASEACDRRKEHEFATNFREKIRELVKEYMPSGAGFDAGTSLNEEKSTSKKLVFTTSFHHMDEHGGYDGWTEHEVIVTPSLVHEYDLRITGRDKNQIKDYIMETFGYALDQTLNA